MSARGFSERDIHMALDGELPDDPAAFAARLNRLAVRGVTQAASAD